MNIIWKEATACPVTQRRLGPLSGLSRSQTAERSHRRCHRHCRRRRRSRSTITSRSNRSNSIRGSVKPTCRMNTVQLLLVEPAVVFVAVLPVPLLHHQPILECQLALRRRAVGRWGHLAELEPTSRLGTAVTPGWEGLWVGGRAKNMQRVVLNEHVVI